jgi:hypothetical protein
MNMKVTFALILSAVCLACGGGTPPPESPEGAEAPAEESPESSETPESSGTPEESPTDTPAEAPAP